MYKLCIDDDSDRLENKSILYKCDKCGSEIKMPIEIIDTFIAMNKMFSEKTSNPTFNYPNCEKGRISPIRQKQN